MFKALGVVAALVAGASAWAADRPQDEPFTDQTFVHKAAACGMHEVAMGKLAQTNSDREDVKAFGERMVADHTKAHEKFLAAAKAAGIQVPSELPEQMKKEHERFQTLKGPAFDREFAKYMVQGHEKAIALFTTASEKCQNAELKAFATETLPTLKEHLAMAKKLLPTAGGQ